MKIINWVFTDINEAIDRLNNPVKLSIRLLNCVEYKDGLSYNDYRNKQETERVLFDLWLKWQA